MKFDYNEYYKILFVASICIMLFSTIAILVDTIIFVKNSTQFKFDKNLLRYIISVALLIFLFSIGFSPFRHGVHLVKEKEIDKIQCVGEITDFKKVYGNNKYVYNGQNTFAYYVFIDNEKYYIMYTGDLKIGDVVAFEYLPKSRIILNIEEK